MKTLIHKQNLRKLAFTNILAFLVMILLNALAAFLPLNGKSTGQLSDQYPNLFTPAGITFSIWSVIYFSLLAFVVFQALVLFKANHAFRKKIVKISPLFIVSCLANAAWIVAWHYERVILSVLIMIVLLVSLIYIHEKLAFALPRKPVLEKCCLDIPFSLYLGWITIATIANITAFLVDQGWQGGPLGDVAWTSIMIVAGCFINIAMVLRKNNIVFGLVGIWSFYGIVLKRQVADGHDNQSVLMYAGIAIGLIASAVLIQVFLRKKRTVTATPLPDIG